MGRDKRNERATGHYTQMFRSTMQTPAWRALSTTAQALYPWLKLEWGGPNANNNGKVSLSVREAANRLSVFPDTAARAFHDLQAKGFIVMTAWGSLGCSGEAKAPLYELTEIALPHSDKRDGRKQYLEWKEGQDFPVQKMRANNPKGTNARTESHPENRDSAITKIVTFRGKQS